MTIKTNALALYKKLDFKEHFMHECQKNNKDPKSLETITSYIQHFFGEKNISHEDAEKLAQHHQEIGKIENFNDQQSYLEQNLDYDIMIGDSLALI